MLQIAVLLAQDGIVTGAVYALLALAIVLVFAVTRVLFLPQGDFVAFAALSLAALQAGVVPPTAWALGLGALLAAAVEAVSLARRGRLRRVPAACAYYLLPAACAIGLAAWLAPQKPALAVQMALAVLLVAPLGPILYRLCFQPVAGASVLVLMFMAVAVHFGLQGLGFMFFGPEGARVPGLGGSFQFAGMVITGQSLLVLGLSVAVMALLYLFFRFTLFGKGLRAAAVNRVGARLVGIRPSVAGQAAFLLASSIGAVSGVLIIGLTTTYYDSGFLIGLNGFVGAAFGALASYPLAVVGALVVGLLQSFGAFWASAYAQAIVFLALVPVLWWLSLRHGHAEEEDEE